MEATTLQKVTKRILLVDDDLDDRELFVEALSDIDNLARVDTLDESEGLVSYLTRLDTLPDYIFLDLNMPRKNGKECLREIQSDERLRKIRIVIYTTSINPRDVTETYQHGAYCFIQKPNSFSELKDILNHVIHSSSGATSIQEGFVISTANSKS